MKKPKKRTIRYEVRSEGDHSNPHFVEYAYMPYYSDVKYDEKSLRSSKSYAKQLSNDKDIETWVVKITEEMV